MARQRKPRINFEIDEEIYSKLRAATLGGIEGVSISDFVRDAIADKLAMRQANPGLSALVNLYRQLTGEGKEWLLQCASIAATSDTTRVIRQRKSSNDENENE